MQFKLLVLFVFLMQAIHSNFAHANIPWNAKKVENISSIKILGRPIENRRTHEKIAFACFSLTDCNLLLPYYFSPTGEIYEFATPLLIKWGDSELTEKETKTAFRKLIKEFKIKERENIIDNIKSFNNGGLEIMGIAGLTFAVMFTGSAWPVAAGVVIVAGGYMMLKNDLFFIPWYNPTISTLSDHDGWNWSVESKIISNRAFNNIAANLLHVIIKKDLKDFDEKFKVKK